MIGTVLKRMSNKLNLIAIMVQQRLLMQCAYAETAPKFKYNRCSSVLIAIIFGLMFGLQNPDDAQVVNSITHSNVIESSVIHAKSNDKASSEEDDTMSTVIGWVAGKVVILGGVVAFVGAIEVGYGFFKNDPGAKTQGWQIIVGGGIIAAAGKGYTTLIGI